MIRIECIIKPIHQQYPFKYKPPMFEHSYVWMFKHQHNSNIGTIAIAMPMFELRWSPMVAKVGVFQFPRCQRIGTIIPSQSELSLKHSRNIFMCMNNKKMKEKLLMKTTVWQCTHWTARLARSSIARCQQQNLLIWILII